MARSSRRTSTRGTDEARCKAIQDYRRPFVDVDRINLAPMLASARELVSAHKTYCDYTSDRESATPQVAMTYLSEVRIAAEQLDHEIKKIGSFYCRSTGEAKLDQQEPKKVDL